MESWGGADGTAADGGEGGRRPRASFFAAAGAGCLARAAAEECAADVFMGQGDLSQALEHYRQALAIKEKALGPEHPSTLMTVANMGMLAEDSGDLAVAKALYVRAAKGFAKCYGPTHPHTLKVQKMAHAAPPRPPQ